MLNIMVLSVGKLKEKFWQDAVAEYSKRLGAYCKLDLVELQEEKLPKNPSQSLIDAALAREAAVIRSKIPTGSRVAALCIEGKLRSSQDLANLLQEQALRPEKRLVFLIGGSYGLDASLKAQCQERISMSPMTFPHHLARVMLLEQIYRGFKILEGSEYHK